MCSRSSRASISLSSRSVCASKTRWWCGKTGPWRRCAAAIADCCPESSILLDCRGEVCAAHERLLAVAVAIEEVDRDSCGLLEEEVCSEGGGFEGDGGVSVTGER